MDEVRFKFKGKTIDGSSTLRSLKLPNFGGKRNEARSTIHMYEDLRNRGILLAYCFYFCFISFFIL